MNDQFKLKLKDGTLVCIDWANVYGWQKKLKWKIDAHKLIEYFRTYPEIKKINFYFGTDVTKESKDFIASFKKIEDNIFRVVTKDVKYIPVEIVDMNKTRDNRRDKKLRRKCDFDVEITRDALNSINNFQVFILVSGDGDYAPLIDDLINKGKKTILVFAQGFKGKEYGDFKKGLFLCSVAKIRKFLEKNIPPIARGA